MPSPRPTDKQAYKLYANYLNFKLFQLTTGIQQVNDIFGFLSLYPFYTTQYKKTFNSRYWSFFFR